jgi:hypothetical protein
MEPTEVADRRLRIVVLEYEDGYAAHVEGPAALVHFTHGPTVPAALRRLARCLSVERRGRGMTNEQLFSEYAINTGEKIYGEFPDTPAGD